MSWQFWVFTTIEGVAAMVTIATIGETRKPTTPRTAVIQLVITGLLIWLVGSIR